MGKVERFFTTVDRAVDKKFAGRGHLFKRYFSVISTLIFGLFILIFFIRIIYSRPNLIASIIEDDVKIIMLAMKKIDSRCNILSIERDRNEVNFLNVKSFSGSEIGPLNLAYPKKWEGPYLRVNPTIQGRFYKIVKASDGWFVVPGEGVWLPNGKKMGKDVVISRKTKVSRLLEKDASLWFNKKKMAAKLDFTIGDWDARHAGAWQMSEEKVKKIDRMLREFNEAMPFTKNVVGGEEIYRV